MALAWSDIGKVVGKAAPILGSVLGGPAGAAAGALVASALGCESQPEAVEKALQASPEMLVKLKELEVAEKSRLLDWQTAQLNAELGNVQSARSREVELVKASSITGWSTSIVAGIVTVGFFVMLYVVLTQGKSELGEPGILLLGSLSTAFGSVVNYYLGSSLGSALKEQYKQRQGK